LKTRVEGLGERVEKTRAPRVFLSNGGLDMSLVLRDE
jgi:hypothetical protein